MNVIILHGRLTKDPERKRTTSGQSVTSFTLAVDREYTSADGSRQADFINCVAWRQTAEFVSRYFTKGDAMLAEGALTIRSYDGNDGQRRTVAEVNVAKVHFVGGRSGARDGASAEAPSVPAAPSAPARAKAATPAPAEKQQSLTDTSGFYPIDDDADIPF